MLKRDRRRKLVSFTIGTELKEGSKDVPFCRLGRYIERVVGRASERSARPNCFPSRLPQGLLKGKGRSLARAEALVWEEQERTIVGLVG